MGDRRHSPSRGTAWGGDVARTLAGLTRDAAEPALLVALADRRVLAVSDALSRVVGRHPADLVGLPLDLVLPRANAGAALALVDALRTHRVADADIELLEQGRRAPQRAIGISIDGETALIRLRPLPGLAPVGDVSPREEEAIASADLVDVADAIGDVLPSLHRLVGPRIELDVRLTGRPLAIRADRQELEQVLLDLAASARDATPAGATLMIEVESRSLDAPTADGAGTRGGDHAVIRAHAAGGDLGSPERLDVSSRADDASPGDGSAAQRLQQVRAVVERLGGAVSVASGRTSGPVVTVTLPLGRTSPRPAGADVPERRPVVLLAEDEAPLRALGRRILERNGFEVHDAASGEEALRVAEGVEVEVLVTDIMLPGIRGRELAERLTALRPGVGVIFMSGYAADDVAVGDLLEAGARFLEKPFPPATLATLVRELAERWARARRTGSH